MRNPAMLPAATPDPFNRLTAGRRQRPDADTGDAVLSELAAVHHLLADSRRTREWSIIFASCL
jgi:hypothetical protein